MEDEKGLQRIEAPSFARTSMSEHVELRVLVPRRIVEVIDAEATVRGGESANVYRATIVTEIMQPWADKKVHDAMVLLRVTGANPTGSVPSSGEVQR